MHNYLSGTEISDMLNCNCRLGDSNGTRPVKNFAPAISKNFCGMRTGMTDLA